MDREYVGIDLHRRRSVIYRMDQAGDQVDSVRVDNDPLRFAEVVSQAPAGSDVVIEATYGWYWAADLLKEMGYVVHLANPQGNDWGHRRVKNDERDARDLADLLRLGRLAEAWIAPPLTRELRELVRFRAKLSHLRTGVKAQAHAVMAKNGVLPCRGDMWGIGGAAQFDALELPTAYSHRIEVLRDLVRVYDKEIAQLDHMTHAILATTPATTPSKRSMGWGGCSGRSLWLRLATWSASAHLRRCPLGPGSPHGIASPTRRSSAGASPNRAHVSCAGPPSRPSPAITAARHSGNNSPSSLNAVGAPRPTWPSPAKFSRSSTTAFETERSAVFKTARRREARTRLGARSLAGKALT